MQAVGALKNPHVLGDATLHLAHVAHPGGDSKTRIDPRASGNLIGRHWSLLPNHRQLNHTAAE
jgi:hypothetical protein